MTEKNKACEVTVTVSGDPGSGKSTLIAVLSQALIGAGHAVDVPFGTPTAIQAITDLSRPYLVTFTERDGRVVAPNGDLEAANAKIARLQERMDEFRDRNIELVHALHAAEAARDEALARIPDPEKTAAAISKALLYAREAAIIDRDRQELTRQTENLKSRAAKMRHESDARMKEASISLCVAFGGGTDWREAMPGAEQNKRRAAARNLSAEDKLALANGKEPKTADEQVIAAALNENAQDVAEAMYEDAGVGYREAVEAMAQTRAEETSPLDVGFPGEVTLASAIERDLNAMVEAHPVIGKLLEGRL